VQPPAYQHGALLLLLIDVVSAPVALLQCSAATYTSQSEKYERPVLAGPSQSSAQPACCSCSHASTWYCRQAALSARCRAITASLTDEVQPRNHAGTSAEEPLRGLSRAVVQPPAYQHGALLLLTEVVRPPRARRPAATQPGESSHSEKCERDVPALPSLSSVRAEKNWVDVLPKQPGFTADRQAALSARYYGEPHRRSAAAEPRRHLG